MTEIQKGLVNMTIEELKNEIVANATSYATETAKVAFLGWVNTKVIPSAKEMANAYIEAVKASAENETGWCKARDTLVIPSLISAGLWLTEQLIAKVAEA